MIESGLSPKTKNILHAAGFDTLKKLRDADIVQLLKLPSFGAGRLREVDVFLGRRCAKEQARLDVAIRLLRANGYKVEA